MSNAESGWAWDFSETYDPREGWRETALFGLESILALGLTLRLVAHVIATAFVYPDGHPFDVRYELGVGWHVRDPEIPTAVKVQSSIVTALVASGAALMIVARGHVAGGLAVVGLANLVVVAGDPLWLLMDVILND